MTPTRRALLVVLLTGSFSGCAIEPIITPEEVSRSIEIFTGRLDVGGAQFYSFTPAFSGTTDVTLVSLRPAGVPASTLTTVVGLGLGTPQGTDCALSSAMTTAPGLTRQLTATTGLSTHCVKVADIGNLKDAVDYTVRVEYP